MTLVMHLCRKVLLINPTKRLGVYFCCLVVISLLTDYFPFPRSYFSDKRNVLNMYFVKWGWGWTCTILGVFVYLTSHTYCGGDRKAISRQMSRLAFATFWWFVCTRLFTHILKTFGHCMLNNVSSTSSDATLLLDRDECKKAGHQWVPFDVSGHAFLLIHCLLTIAEEVRCIADWECINEVAAQEQQGCTDSCRAKQLQLIRGSYETHTPFVYVLMFVLTLLIILWEMMLLGTAVYFHNMQQKLTGAIFAALGWFVFYRVWYTSVVSFVWTPGPTGCGLIRYQKDV
jgi:hypothetical protein